MLQASDRNIEKCEKNVPNHTNYLQTVFRKYVDFCFTSSSNDYVYSISIINNSEIGMR